MTTEHLTIETASSSDGTITLFCAGCCTGYNLGAKPRTEGPLSHHNKGVSFPRLIAKIRAWEELHGDCAKPSGQ